MDGEGIDQGQREREAAARGEGIRAELVALLSDGPRAAADLLPLVKTEAASLSEVAFQLERLESEGRAVGAQDGRFRLA